LFIKLSHFIDGCRGQGGFIFIVSGRGNGRVWAKNSGIGGRRKGFASIWVWRGKTFKVFVAILDDTVAKYFLKHIRK